MGAAVLTDQGEKQLLSQTLAARLFLRLFRNNVTVTYASLLPDFDPALFPGYADVEVTSLWPVPSIDGTGQAYSQLPPVQWTRGAGGVPETEYGWVLYQNPYPSSVLVAGQNFASPIIVNAPGQVVAVTVAAFLLRG